MPIIRLLAALAGLLLMPALWAQPAAGPGTPGQAFEVLDAAAMGDADCLTCHERREEGIKVRGTDGELHEPPAVARKAFHTSVHGEMACTDCHEGVSARQVPHDIDPASAPDCATCHQELWAEAKAQGLSQEKARLGVVVDNIEAYLESYHAPPRKGADPKATCEDCHATHGFDILPRGTTRRTEWHLRIPDVCGQCHEDALEDYSASIHGTQVLTEGNPKAAVCTDCHTSHDITKTRRDPFQLAVTRECGSCHDERFSTYRDTYHGKINTLGYTFTAKCYDCHGSHGIVQVSDPASPVHPDNRLETCQECHDGRRAKLATAGFLTFAPHANTHDFEKYPQVYVAAKFMHGLLLFVFAYFWAHSLLWWYREYKDRKAGRGHMYVYTENLVPQSRQVRRFGAVWRVAHLAFAVSVMVLILTGMTLYYAYTDWAPVVIEAFGGPRDMGYVHRVAATVMLGIFFLHLIGVSINIARKKERFRWFGPDSLVPNWKDFKDAWGMFKWFVNKGPKPEFDRWTYWEKFDYWAVFWGMAIIGTSGVMLAFPDVTASIFPGWVFNVVMLVHGEEAFLAAVFLFTVHFFNNHFRPDKLPPPDIVIFTGSQSLEEFKRDHALQYQRLVESGELDKYLVQVPSKPMTWGSRILGLTLIAAGLTLLVMVAIGFFGGYQPG